MKLFPDRARMKVLMGRGLPLVFAIAWAPLVWMLLAGVVGNALTSIFRSWQPVVAVLATLTIAVMCGLVLVFRRFALKIFDDNTSN